MILETTSDVMDALGGNKGTALVTGSTPKAASNWRNGRRFPARTFPAMNAALKAKGYAAPNSLWGIPEMQAPATSPESSDEREKAQS